MTWQSLLVCVYRLLQNKGRLLFRNGNSKEFNYAFNDYFTNSEKETFLKNHIYLLPSTVYFQITGSWFTSNKLRQT